MAKRMKDIGKMERNAVIRRLNPHFLFNTLGAVRIAARTDPELAYDRIYDISRYLRAVIGSFERPENILFREEIDDVLSYINLEKLRFGDKAAVRMELQEEDFRIPPFTVLPLVDNALRHGLQRGDRKGTVTVRSCRLPEEYIVQVEDDGAGFEPAVYDAAPGAGKARAGGLFDVRERMEKMVNGGMDILSYTGVGTVITLHIPVVAERRDDCHENKDDYSR
ncbi:MAG: histidine kinase [Blautia sp.]|nr:histidine kinase [Blautia sp.]MCM1200198.1 histidine kinase [Bacteroides fragilis]